MRVSVCDTGQGLAPDLLVQLFQPFNRLGQESSGIEGSGVGLVVSKQLVELMGGEIGVRSEVGIGSTFWFELPLSTEPIADTGGINEVTPMEPKLDTTNVAQRTLLYVEDNPANLNLIEQLIERRSDLKLLIATNGRSGVQLAREQLPDLILMDINLPDISGLEALKLLKAIPETARIPIMALTAYAIPQDIENGLRAGFLRYLTKPIKINEFMDAINAALGKTDESAVV